MGQTGDKKYTVFVNVEMEIVFSLVSLFFIFYYMLGTLGGGL